jgi:hypothetical protein
MKAIPKIDRAADTMLVAGALGSALTGLLRNSTMRKHGGRKSAGTKLYLGILSAATAYKLIRTLGPKTKEEQRLIKVAKLYDKANSYQQRASLYRSIAEKLFQRQAKQLKRWRTAAQP